MRPFQQIIIPSALTVFTSFLLFLLINILSSLFQFRYNSPITLVIPVVSGIIGTYVYFGVIHRTGLNLSGREVLVLSLVTTIFWTFIWTITLVCALAPIIWGYNTVDVVPTVLANIVICFPTYTVGGFICTLILRQIARTPEAPLAMLPQLFKQLRSDENVLWVAKPALISSITPNTKRILRVPNTVAFIIVGLMGLYSLITRPGDLLSIFVFIGFISLALATLLLLLIRIIRAIRERPEYILTNQRLVIQAGNEKPESVELENIRNISVRTDALDDILERVFRVRTIVVQTPGNSSERLSFINVKEPSAVKKMFLEAVVNNIKGNQLISSPEDLQTPRLPKSVFSVLKDAAQRSLDNHFRFERELLMGELCQHLRDIGVKAVLLEPDSPEAFRYPPYVLGHVRTEGRNIDGILVQYSSSGGGDSDGGSDKTFAHYRYFYVVRANLDGLESKLKADFKSNWHDRCSQKRNFKQTDKTLMDREISDCRWEGGELAKLLNADSELTQTLYNEGLDRLEVRPDRGHRRVRMEHWHWKAYSSRDIGSGDLKDKYDGSVPGGTYVSSVGRKQFPTREAFEAYDRIAYCIRRTILTSRPTAPAGAKAHE